MTSSLRILLDRTTHQWMIGQDIDPFGDKGHRVEGSRNVDVQKKIHETIEVFDRPACVDQLRQDFAFGFAAAFP